MDLVLRLHTEETLPVDVVQQIGQRAMEAIDQGGPVRVVPMMLIELGPNYLEVPISPRGRSKHVD